MSRAWDAGINKLFAQRVFDIVNDPETDNDEIAQLVSAETAATYGDERP